MVPETGGRGHEERHKQRPPLKRMHICMACIHHTSTHLIRLSSLFSLSPSACDSPLRMRASLASPGALLNGLHSVSCASPLKLPGCVLLLDEAAPLVEAVPCIISMAWFWRLCSVCTHQDCLS